METLEKTHVIKSNLSSSDIIDFLIETAIRDRASDIHIDPYEHIALVKFRIDGLMKEMKEISKEIHLEIVGRVKVLARLRPDLHHIPQDGRFRQNHLTKGDIRVSIIPTYYGENIVLRLLGESLTGKTLTELGMNLVDEKAVQNGLARTSGLVLVTGPTGSGKTTTLYSLITQLPKNKLIVTIEDPVEYIIPGSRQIQINPRQNLSFASALRSVLRQDPDIIMVGEIRDTETAHLAVHAALTGHLVLSTLHTKDAISAIARLIDLEIPAYLIASTLELVVAERLTRKICALCKKNNQKCEQCGGSGLSGRVGIFETLIIEEKVRRAIFHHIATDEIKTLAREQGVYTDMKVDATEKIESGITTREEVSHIFL